MAPKPSSAKSPKKPMNSFKKKKGDKEEDMAQTLESIDGEKAAPQTKEEALAQVDFEGLPSTVQKEQITELLNEKYDAIVKIFAHYCKLSECKTVEMATRLHLVGFKKLVKDSGLELKVYDIGQMSRLFNLKGGAKGIALDAEDGTSLGIEQFLTLLVHLAFYRENPRYAPQLAGAPKMTQETVPVLQCVQNMFNDYLPKMRKGDQAEFRKVLKGDGDAQAVLESYNEKLTQWATTLAEKAGESSDVYMQYFASLEETGSLGVRSLDVTESTGIMQTHKSSLTELQARHAFLDTQDAANLSVGKPVYDAPLLIEALARCGDKKYSSIMEMPFAKKIESMFKNVLNEATELQCIEEFVGTDAPEGAEAYDERVKEALKKNWLICWKNMTFKDLYGYPLWETQLHDVLSAAFPELQSIFLYYTGSSIAGAESIASATRLGLMEMLSLAKDCDICTKEFKVDEVTRHFSTANAQAAVANSGSSDRHKMPKQGTAGGKMTLREKAITEREKKKVTDSSKGARVAEKADMQLNLFEFINFLARIAFWRANPQWGSKYNKKDLTPVPESVQILLEECILPNAKRDTSGDFKKVLQADQATLSTLAEYRERLQAWLRPILRKERSTTNPNPRMTYEKWVQLMDGPDLDSKDPRGPKPSCPKMVGEWYLSQESQITGDERTSKKNQMTFKAKLSIPQCRWNFLRSQTIEQVEGGEVDAKTSDLATLDFNELNECIARCAVNMYEHMLTTFLPSHNRKAMSMADAVRAWIQNLFFEKSPEMCMWEATVIKADRYDWQKQTKMLPGFSQAQHKLWLQCWEHMQLVDIHHFPLWEKGVHDTLQQNFPVIMRIFSHYTKGISGIDSAADALEMELEEFHDFVKDSKIETRMVNFTTLTNVFAKANAANSDEAFEARMRGRRNVQVQRELEELARQAARSTHDGKPGTIKGPELPKHLTCDRFAADYPEPGSMKVSKPDNRLTLTEFLGCLVRISFLRANPKHGQYDNKAKLVELPGCLKKMLEDVMIPNAKQDMSSLFRDEIAQDAEVQAVFEEFREKLTYYYTEVNQLTAVKGKVDNKLSMETWMDIARGYLTFTKRKGSKHMEKSKSTVKPGESAGLGESALCGDCTVLRESDITGDERCKEKFTCRLSVLEAKYGFLNSQSLEQMAAGDAGDSDLMATLDYDEFLECLARCARDKYGEIKLMTLSDGVRGICQNILGEKTDEAVIRDATYIHAERYNWKLSKPLPGQSLAAHRKWLDCWQNIEIADLHYFPLWEKGVFDCLQECFQDLTNIFAHYAKSIGGSTTAEDAVEMTMTEFKDLVKDVGLETKDLKFDVMSNMFKKANALNSNAVMQQRKQEAGTADAKREGVGSTSKAMSQVNKRSKSGSKGREDEMDMELVLYEFVEVLIRIGFWRANPYHGINKLAAKLVPLPDCLHTMLHEVVLPNAKRDDSALFKERLAGDKAMQSALATYEKKLKEWFDVHTQSMFLRGEGRKLQYQQWQDLLKKGWGTDPRAQGYTPGNGVGNWEIYQDSEITGDERCRNKFKISLSLPQAKFAFINSQSLDQLTVGQAKDTDAMTTLEFDEFKECIARCALDKYKPIRQMSAAVMITSFCKNLLGEENTEECMNTATLIKAERYNWKRYSQTLPGQTLKEHKKWLECWQRIEISDMYYFPLWEKGVHDILQKHFQELSLIFLAYCRSLLGSDTAEDAMEMEMSEFKDFVDECGLETKAINFDLMSNMFIKANATNSAQVRDQHHEARRSAATKMDGRTTAEVAKVKGTSDGQEAKKDQELVLYEFIGMLVRIAFQRANPTFGNFGNKKAVVHLVNYPGSGMTGVGCLESMLVDEILPRARKDTSAAFRETVMTEVSVLKVLDEYRPKVKKWYDEVTNDDSKQTDLTDKLQMEQWMRICDEKDLVGIWECYRESDITGDPACKTQYKWRLSMPQVKMAFMDSQASEQLGVAQSSGTDSMAVLDFEEFLECCARLGIDKYRAVKEVAPALAVRGFMQNLLGEKTPDEVVLAATHIHAERYDAARDTKLLKGETQVELDKWLACWERMEIMDVHLWPVWEKEVHDILHPVFKEMTSIFLAYTRSISEDSAEDAMEMSMDEFHDFVVDVGLETKQYNFDVMCNQFVKANATNTAQVRAQRQEEKRDAQSRGNDKPEWAKAAAAPKKVKGTSTGEEAKKDQELVLYEFMNMMIRIAFWRANPNFGLHGNKDELVPVSFALATMLNEIILPRAKRENSAAFRQKEMMDAKLLTVLDTYKAKLREWYDKKVADDSDGSKNGLVSDKIGFDEWLRVLDRQDIVGEWEVEQMSEITGDESTKGNIKCRLSIPTCKAAFMDSQRTDQLGVGQADSTSEQSVLDFDEWLECLCRIATAKYSAIKQMDNSQKVKAFLQNFFGECSEEDCMRQATYIRAVRYDISESLPLKDETPEEHAAFLAEFKQLNLEGLYGFPLWEQEVHDILHENFKELTSIFRAYCKSLGESSSDESAKTMDVEEFHDFVIDVGLETRLQVMKGAEAATYTFEQMKEQFTKADKSGKGLAGPAANSELVLYEFMNVLTRVSFYRMNPEYGELTMEHQTSILPVPQALDRTIKEAVLPKAHRDDAAEFRSKVMSMPEVQAALAEGRPRLQAWFATIPLDDNQKVGITQWVSTLQALNVIGTFTCTQGSDIVGDDRVGTEFKCRLSVPQSKAAFVNAQKESGSAVEDVSLDFDELLECIARCGADKYRAVEEIKMGDKVAAMVANILGDLNEEQVITAATYITAERFTPAGSPPKGISPEQHRDWLMTWEMLQLSNLPGFPLWEKDVHDVLAANLEALQSIFRAYAAGSIGSGQSASEMDMEEFHDFVIEADLITDAYGFDTMAGQFTKANAGSNDQVLELHEFLTMLVRISFYRANPQYGMRLGDTRKGTNVGMNEKNATEQFGEEVPLPGCLSDMLTHKVLANARLDTHAQEFAETTLPLPEVQSALSSQLEQLSTFYEMVSAGRPFLELDQWLGALESKLLFSDLTIDGYAVRLTEPQAKAAFYASAATPASGLLPDELPVCVARTACDKYKLVLPMGPGAKVAGFLNNLLGDDDEEDVVMAATGGKSAPRQAAPVPVAQPAPVNQPVYDDEDDDE